MKNYLKASTTLHPMDDRAATYGICNGDYFLGELIKLAKLVAAPNLTQYLTEAATNAEWARQVYEANNSLTLWDWLIIAVRKNTHLSNLIRVRGGT